MLKIFTVLLFSFSAHATGLDPELLAMVGKYKLASGGDSCATGTEVEKLRAEETLSIKDLNPSSRKAEISLFPGINAGEVTYHQGFRVLKQRKVVYENGVLKKMLRSCRGIIMQTCYAWSTTAFLKILTTQSFELSYKGKTCLYESL